MTAFDDLYCPHTTPFQHQAECLRVSYAKRAFAYLLDPGLGKTKVTLDLAQLWFQAGHITGLLVAAYNEVHRQWIEEQIPIHWSPVIPIRSVVWESSNARALRLTKALIASTTKGMHVLCINHEALSTKIGREMCKRFLQSRPCLFALDDSHEFKTPGAARTRAVTAIGDLAFGRRILTGTLTGGDPFNAYAQFRFLDPRILGCDSFLSFKHQYGVFQDRTVMGKQVNPSTGKRKLVTFEELQDYQNLDQLNALMAPFTYSKHKEDCEDLPPKLPQTVPTRLSKAQRALYNHMLEDGLALLERAEGGASIKVANPAAMDEDELAERILQPQARVTFKIKLTLLLRLQQCAAGIVTDDSGHTTVIDGSVDKCPRYTDMLQWLQQTLHARGKVIIWANYRPVLELLHQYLRDNVPQAWPLLIHGGVTGQQRKDAVANFKDPRNPCRILTAHPRVMGTGQNFEVASSVMFFTRSFSLFQRTQAEDRAHRLSSKGTVTIADMVAHDAGTDHKEMETLARKLDLVSKLESFKAKDLREMLRC